jgi:hypothetical protein
MEPIFINFRAGDQDMAEAGSEGEIAPSRMT